MNSTPKDVWSAIGSLRKWVKAGPALQRDSGRDSFPLSFAQNRIWSIERIAPGDPAFNIPMAWLVEGEIDVERLQRSLKGVLDRHDILRTRFMPGPNGTVQVITPEMNLRVVVKEVTGNSPDERRMNAVQSGKGEAREPFDVLHGPLMRASLYLIGRQAALLVITFHQLVFDGWSKAIFNRDLHRSFELLRSRAVSQPPGLPIQYGDFSGWQRLWWNGKIVEEHTEFWDKVLRPVYQPLQLSGMRFSLHNAASASARKDFVISPELTLSLKSLAGHEDVTLYMTLLAIFSTVLHRYTNQDDIMVFSSFANRFRREFRELIGLFANILPLRVSVAGSETFRVLLQRVRDIALEAFAHPLLPFEDIVSRVRRASNSSHESLFQAMLILQTSLPKCFDTSGASFVPIHDIDNEETKFDLFLEIEDTRQELRVDLTFKTGLFSSEFIDTFVEDFIRVAQIATVNPGSPLNAMPLKGSRVEEEDSQNAQPLISSGGVVPPRDPAELQTCMIWEGVLGIRPIGIRDNFFDLGGTSLIAARLLAEVERVSGKNLPLTALYRSPTVESFSEHFRQDAHSPFFDTIVPLHVGGGEPPLFLVHGVGGNIVGFRDLARSFPKDQSLLAFQARGLDRIDPPFTRIQDMAAYYVKAITTNQPHGPYHLAGYSFGGLVAFEMAQQLVADGRLVDLLVLIDTVNPNADLGFFSRVALHVGHALHLGKGEMLKYLAKKFRDLVSAGKPKRAVMSRIEPRTLLEENLMKIRQTHDQAAQNYFPHVYPGRITLLCASKLGDSGIRAPNNGWNGLSAEGLDVRHVPGNHLDLVYADNAPVLAEVLASCLREAQAARGRIPNV